MATGAFDSSGHALGQSLGDQAGAVSWLALVAAAMLYTLAGFSLAPWLVERQAPRLVEAFADRALAG